IIDFAMKRPAVRCATDFGKTARMDSPTVKRFLPWVVATALFMEHSLVRQNLTVIRSKGLVPCKRTESVSVAPVGRHSGRHKGPARTPGAYQMNVTEFQ